MIGADGVTGASGVDRGSAATSSSVVVVMVATSAAGGVTATGSASLTVAGGSASSLRSVLVKVPQPVSTSPTKSQTMADGEQRTSDPPRAHGLYLRYRQTIAAARARLVRNPQRVTSTLYRRPGCRNVGVQERVHDRKERA